MRQTTHAPTRLSETENWAAMSDISRRSAILGGAAAMGYALAAQPVMAQRIVTPREGLVEGMVTFKAANDFAMKAYRAYPKDKPNAPVVLVVQEIFGLHEWLQDITRRLAHAGYYAIAPNLFQREGDPTKPATVADLFKQIVSRVPDAQVMQDLDAAVLHAARDGADANRLGITGFCWGGRISWLYNAHNPKLKVGVPFYGRLTGEANPLQPLHPIDVVGRQYGVMRGLYGALDKGIPLADVERMQQALVAASGQRHTIRVFAEADHGYMADYRPSFHPDAAAQSWDILLESLQTYL